ncbi:hypothetical protein NFI96_016867, partial [Prochilodus magdalenae]
MRVDNRAEDHGRSGPRINAMQPSRGMDSDGQQGSPHRRQDTRFGCPDFPACDLLLADLGAQGVFAERSSKSKAPPPPPVLHGTCGSPSDPAFPHAAMEQKENLLEQELLLTVVLPEGVEKTTVVHGSKPMMDLLVMLCAKYHLNPSGHTIELVSTNRNHIKFKPNALIGALEAEKVLLKPKGMEDKNKKTGPQMPEATVRMVINYKKTQKTILRVNPRLPLQELLPAICEKCEFEPKSTVLLRNVHSEEPLDLSSSLNELGIREVYARDTRVIRQTSFPPSPTHSDIIQSGKDKLQKEKENKGLFGLFKRGSKKKHDQASTVSAPASPVHRKQRPVSMSSLSTHSPTYDSNTMPSDTPKKRRAPLPPNMMPSDLSHHSNAQPTTQPDGNQDASSALSRSSSAGSSLKRSKRKAPPPPTSTGGSPAAPEEASQDRAVTGLPLALEEIQEKEESPMSTEAPVTPASSSSARASPISPSLESPSPVQELLEDDSGSINLSADISLDSGRAGTASPSQDSEMENVAPPRGNSEDMSCDLTTDGKQAANLEVNRDRPETDALLQPADNADNKDSTEAASLTADDYAATKEEGTSMTVVSQDSVVQDPAFSHIDAITQTQQAEPQAPPRSEASGQGVQNASPTAASVSHTHMQIQTDTLCESTEHESTTRPTELLPAPPSASSKRDMATSTEELQTPAIHPPLVHSPERQTSIGTHTPEGQTLTHTLESKGQLSAQIPPATKAGNLQYIVESEPKPKPSNELTRDYIPKVGMTTYTIVPQRSLDKLRFFEVELTLESPNMPGAQVVSPECSEGLGDPVGISSQAAMSPHSTNGPATPLLSMNCSSELSHSVPSSPALPEAGDSSFSADRGGPEVMEKKAPPATRPKPASFRLPQHKKTPGSYVSSAAVRSMSVSDSSSSSPAGGGQRESLASPRRESYPGATQENFPPPPPPMQWKEKKETAEGQNLASLLPLLKQEEPERAAPVLSQREAEVSSGAGRVLPRQTSLPSREPTAGLSLEKLRSFAAPKPYSSTTQSRFAQAVSSAVKRSQSLSLSPVGQYSHKVPLVLTQRSPIRESLDSPESPTTTNVETIYENRKAGTETPSADCSDLALSDTCTETEGMWKNGVTDHTL